MSSPTEIDITNPSANLTDEQAKSKKEKKQSVTVNDPTRFQYGVLLRGKFIGVEDVKKESGDEICQTAMIKLKAVVAAKKEHKQRICVKINLEGLEILDEKTNQTMFKHSVNRISYIARDVTDARAIGYIYKNSPNNFQYFAIKTERQAQELFNTLKELFEVVLEMRSAAKKKDEDSEEKEINSSSNTEEKKDEETSTSKTLNQSESISGLEEKIKQMNQQPSLLDLQEKNTFEDSFQSSIEKSGDLLQSSQTNSNPSNEIFNLFDNTPTISQSNPTPTPTPTQTPTQNDKYNSLLNDLSNLSTSPIPRVAPIPPMGMNPNNSNIFGNTNPSMNMPPVQYFGQTLPNQTSNPFGGLSQQPIQSSQFQTQPNPMLQQNQFQMQRPSVTLVPPVPPVPQGGTMFGIQPGMAQTQPMAPVQQNPFASNQSNQQQQNSNQFLW